MNIDKKYYQEINDNLTNTIQDTNIDAPNKKVGKVRDAYFLDDKVVMISTDRQSAFDRVLAAIPYKGAVLNSVSGDGKAGVVTGRSGCGAGCGKG